MTIRKQALIDLREKVKAGAWLSIRDEPGPDTGLHLWWQEVDNVMDFGSLDAALALHNALLPGWLWGRLYAKTMWVEADGVPGRNERYYGESEHPARSWLLAMLSALIEGEP